MFWFWGGREDSGPGYTFKVRVDGTLEYASSPIWYDPNHKESELENRTANARSVYQAAVDDGLFDLEDIPAAETDEQMHWIEVTIDRRPFKWVQIFTKMLTAL